MHALILGLLFSHDYGLGWGHTKHRGWVSKVLQKVTVTIHSTNDCQASIPKSSSFKVTDRMICAGVPNGKQDACQVYLKHAHLKNVLTLI